MKNFSRCQSIDGGFFVRERSSSAENIGSPPHKSATKNAAPDTIISQKKCENCPVSSKIKMLPVTGALMTAAKNAAMPKIINSVVQSAVNKSARLPTRAKMFPINAPIVNTGKNKPPGAFVPKHISV